MKNWFGILIMIIALALILFSQNGKEKDENNNEIIEEKQEPTIEYGFITDSFVVKKGQIEKDQTLGELLYLNHIDHPQINAIVNKSNDIFDFRRAKTGNNYMVLCSKDSSEIAKCFIYEESSTTYVVFDLRNGIDVYKGKKKITVKTNVASGEIKSSLWNALVDNNLSPEAPALVMELSTIYAWTIDFFRIQKGDSFKVYYENKYVEDDHVGIGRVLASEFTHKGEVFYAFYFEENENFSDYFDEEGKTLRKAFLRAPLKFSRISSRYSKKRKHPVTGRWKGHFGTDYAAPKGTPIMSTANGTIIEASKTKNNGNYVKVRHNNTYTTQYLHMTKIKPGIRKGVFVKQGDVIGYVGSTGLATGPHVCYRFWKHGKQVDPYKEKLPPSAPIKEKNRGEYMIVKDSLMNILISNNS